MKDFKDKSKIQVHVSNVTKNMFDRKYSKGKSNSNKKDTIRRNGKIGVKSNNTRELNRGFEASRTVGRFEKNSFFWASLYKWWMCQDPLRKRERA